MTDKQQILDEFEEKIHLILAGVHMNGYMQGHMNKNVQVGVINEGTKEALKAVFSALDKVEKNTLERVIEALPKKIPDQYTGVANNIKGGAGHHVRGVHDGWDQAIGKTIDIINKLKHEKSKTKTTETIS